MKLYFYIISVIFPFSFSTLAKYPYPANRSITLRPDIMAKCMMGNLVVDTRTIYPQDSYPNNYRNKGGNYPKECQYTHNAFWDYLTTSDINRTCDFETGNENELKKWILSQRDNSIDPVSIFRKSMEINNGHIFNSLLTVHQLLRNEARWRSTKYYHYSSSAQEEDIFFRKFIDIRGELKERGEGFEGNHQGSWYRMWGIALYRISLVDKKSDINRCTKLKPNPINSFKSSMVALLAELAKYIHDITGSRGSDSDRQGKARINNMGSKMGTEIIRLSSGLRLNSKDKDNCLNKKYIMAREHYYSPSPPSP